VAVGFRASGDNTLPGMTWAGRQQYAVEDNSIYAVTANNLIVEPFPNYRPNPHFFDAALCLLSLRA
jgi:hypothetical protein